MVVTWGSISSTPDTLIAVNDSNRIEFIPLFFTFIFNFAKSESFSSGFRHHCKLEKPWIQKTQNQKDHASV
jgi:hypothetical protein